MNTSAVFLASNGSTFFLASRIEFAIQDCLMDLSAPLTGNQNRGPTLVIVIWILAGLALIVVSIKIYTRIKIIREPVLDDVFTVLAVVLVTICASFITASVHAGLGRHANDLTLDQQLKAMKLSTIASPFGMMAYSLPNISVAIFLDRILFPAPLRKWLIYSLVVVQNLAAAIGAVLLFLQCATPQIFWHGRCLSPSMFTNYSYFLGALTAVTDVILAITPVAAFWRLQLKTTTKIGLCLLMGTTMLAAICAVVKTLKVKGINRRPDMSYLMADFLLWAVMESIVIIIAACVPGLRPFIISVSRSVRGTGPRIAPPSDHFVPRYSLKALSVGDNNSYGFNSVANAPARTNKCSASLESRSDQSLPPQNTIKRDTKFTLEWKNV